MALPGDGCRRHRREKLALVSAASLVVLCGGGCTRVLKDIAMAPLEVMEHVAVETAKLPYETAKIGASSLFDATIGNAERAIRGELR